MPLVVAIDSGASTSTTFEGITFEADRYAVGGSQNSTADPISGVADYSMFQTERYGAYRYEVPVTAAGQYTVALYFAEIYLTAAGERSFSVAIEGNTVLNDIDLYSLAGHDGAYSYVADDIQVSDGGVTIELIAGVENPTLAGFAIYSNDGELDTTVPTDPGGPIFTGEKFVGNITTNGQVRSDFIQYWNQITPENEGKWGSVEGTRDNYNWGPLDRIYEYARQHDIPVKAHTLVWGSQQPGWIDGLSAAEQRAEIEEWIYGPGIPANPPQVLSPRLGIVDSARLGWRGSKQLPPAQITGEWSTQEWLHFLEGMPATLPVADLEQLDTAYGFTGTANGEIAMRWYPLAIRSGHAPASAAAADFIGRVGRRKLIIPIYEALVETAPGLALARETFERARPGYHPITTASVERVIAGADPAPAAVPGEGGAAPGASGSGDAADAAAPVDDAGPDADPDAAAGPPEASTD